MRYCDQAQLKKINEIVDAKLALEVFDTGIFDSHSYFQSLLFEIENSQGLISLNTNVVAIDRNKNDILTLCEQGQNRFTIRSKYTLNLSGIEALNITKKRFPKNTRCMRISMLKVITFLYARNSK